MLRIHFTATDLARTQLAGAPDPLWETVLSLQMLRARYATGTFGGWRVRAREAIQRAGQAKAVSGLLFPLTPDATYFPDFLTPPEGLLGLAEGLEAVRATPRVRLRRELWRTVGDAAPPWMCRLAGGDREASADLARALRAYHRVALGPYWDRMRSGAALDHSRHLRRKRASGITEVLRTFAPAVRWDPPVLAVPYPLTKDLYLRGRGLTLVPSYFCWNHPVALADPELPPTLVYPLRPTADFLLGDEVEPSALDRLIGPARSRVLRVTGDGATTTELAGRAGIALASASRHAAILREAGLITSHRDGNAVVHVVSDLGRAVLGEV